jgi:hypothetical protein
LTHARCSRRSKQAHTATQRLTGLFRDSAWRQKRAIEAISNRVPIELSRFRSAEWETLIRGNVYAGLFPHHGRTSVQPLQVFWIMVSNANLDSGYRRKTESWACVTDDMVASEVKVSDKWTLCEARRGINLTIHGSGTGNKSDNEARGSMSKTMGVKAELMNRSEIRRSHEEHARSHNRPKPLHLAGEASRQKAVVIDGWFMLESSTSCSALPAPLRRRSLLPNANGCDRPSEAMRSNLERVDLVF